MNFIPCVEQLETRYCLSSISTAKEAKKAYESFLKEELKIFTKNQIEKRKRFLVKYIVLPIINIRPRVFRIQPYVPFLTVRPPFKLSPNKSLEYHMVVWAPRLEKYFSIWDNRLKDAFALIKLDAVIIPGIGVITIVKAKKFVQNKLNVSQYGHSNKKILIFNKKVAAKIALIIKKEVLKLKNPTLDKENIQNNLVIMIVTLGLLYGLWRKTKRRKRV